MRSLRREMRTLVGQAWNERWTRMELNHAFGPDGWERIEPLGFGLASAPERGGLR